MAGAVRLQPRDIVERLGGPAEVLAVFPAQRLVFILNKRSLLAEFVAPEDVKFVRRPAK